MLGLAISIVSAVPEKVWFCTKKGYAPWERPKRQDVGTHEEGGHTIWYSEPELMQVCHKLRLKCQGHVRFPEPSQRGCLGRAADMPNHSCEWREAPPRKRPSAVGCLPGCSRRTLGSCWVWRLPVQLEPPWPGVSGLCQPAC